MKKLDRNQRRTITHRRVRKKIRGTGERPRLAVYRSIKHIYAQAIDDESGVTLAQASTVDKQLRTKLRSGADVEAAKAVGELIAERLKARGCETIVFDRGGYVYHGRVQALADGVRSGGLQF